MKPKKVLSKSEINFIKENYLQMTDAEIGKELGLNDTFIWRVRYDENLPKKPCKKGVPIDDGYFHVSDKKNWAI